MRPFEAVARLAAPLFPNPSTAKEENERAQDILDDELTFRMPSSSGARRCSISNSDTNPTGAAESGLLYTSSVAGGGLDGQEIGRTTEAGTFDWTKHESPPATSSSPLKNSKSRRSLNNRRSRGRWGLGAIKLDLTLPGLQERRRRVSCSPIPGRAEASSESSAMPSPDRRRASLSSSPCRPSNGSDGLESENLTHRRRTIAGDVAGKNGTGGNRRQGKGEAAASPVRAIPGISAKPECRDCLPCPLSSSCIAEGSTVNLRALVNASGNDLPRTYRCRDGSVVVVGAQRIICANPISSEMTTGEASRESDGSGTGQGDAVVNWLLSYSDFQSCCVNVSAVKGRGHAVGDVVVEIVAR